MFVWARVPSAIHSVEKLVDYLLYEHHVFITPGFIFGEKGNRFIRLSLCTTESRLQQVIDRFSQLQFPAL
jgi:aspartate/methionine/tyrosine aminotransferase